MMKLIDADTAIAAVEWGITRATLINIETGEKTHPFDAINEELQKAIERIKKLPTVESKRGTWTRHDIGWDFALFECSECFGETMAAYPFCPHCGIPMEKEVKQDEVN